MGIELAQNFKMPFFSRNPGEFWRRWHTSLRKWMLDYLYVPLGGNKGSQFHYIMVMLFIFSFSGLWHGANVTFICWGLLNGLYFLPYILTNRLTRYKDVVAKGRLFPSFKEAGQMLFIFIIMTMTRIFFRSPNMTVARGITAKIFSASLFEAPVKIVLTTALIGLPMLAVEWIQREKLYVLQADTLFLGRYIPQSKAAQIFIKFAVYAIVIVAIYIWHKQKNMTEYYYFKF
jgi:D-alanyl-lipoteichoic acid acyltransferase DltB (MBOAT superfamily)